MFFKELIDLCDDFSKSSNKSMSELAQKAIEINFYHYKKQQRMFSDMCLTSEKEDMLDEFIQQNEIYVNQEKGQLYYKTCSPACKHCVEDMGYTARISTFCNRDCFFCFASESPMIDVNTIDVSKFKTAFILKNKICPIKSFAISGGEPLINVRETLELFGWIRDNYSKDIYCRLYTNGDYITEDILVELKKVKLNEIRLSIKPGEQPSKEKIGMIKRFIPQLVIEIPIIPGEKEYLFRLYDALENTAIDGINLVELFFNGNKKNEFNMRNLKIEMTGGIRKFGCAEFPYEYPIAGSYGLAVESLKYISTNKYHYFAYICSQHAKKAQYCSSNKKQIHKDLNTINDGTVDEDGNIVVIAIICEKERIREICESKHIPFYVYNDSTFLLPMSKDKILPRGIDSCYLTLNKAMQPVWIQLRSIISQGYNSKMKELQKN